MIKALTKALLLVLMSASLALADWAEDFMATTAKSGTDTAVTEAFKDGVAPADIVKMTQQTGGVAPAAVVKALYCAGVSGSAVQAAANEAGVSSSDVVTGYRQSVGQCGPAAALNADPFSNTRNVASGGTPVGSGDQPPAVILPPIDGGGGGGSGGGGVAPPQASPDRFD